MIDREHLLSLRDQVYIQRLDSEQRVVIGGEHSESFYMGRASGFQEVFMWLTKLIDLTG